MRDLILSIKARELPSNDGGYTYYFFNDGTYECSHWEDEPAMPTVGHWKIEDDFLFFRINDQNWTSWSWLRDGEHILKLIKAEISERILLA